MSYRLKAAVAEGGRQSKGSYRRFLDVLNRVYSGGSNAAARHALSTCKELLPPYFPVYGGWWHTVSLNKSTWHIWGGGKPTWKYNHNSKKVWTLFYINKTECNHLQTNSVYRLWFYEVFLSPCGNILLQNMFHKMINLAPSLLVDDWAFWACHFHTKSQ